MVGYYYCVVEVGALRVGKGSPNVLYEVLESVSYRPFGDLRLERGVDRWFLLVDLCLFRSRFYWVVGYYAGDGNSYGV